MPKQQKGASDNLQHMRRQRQRRYTCVSLKDELHTYISRSPLVEVDHGYGALVGVVVLPQ